MKKAKIIFMIFLTTLLFSATAFADSARVIKLSLKYDGKTVEYREREVTVVVDGKELDSLDMPAVIINSRALVPLRAIFEALGADVQWDGKLKKITANYNDDTIIMFIDNKAGVVNGNAFNMEVAPKIINDRTMVPVRAIAEALGASVAWDDAERTVNIKSYIVGGDDSGLNNSDSTVIGSDADADDSGNATGDNTGTANPSAEETTSIPAPDPQKVTDLSHVDTSEIDKEALANSNNEVSVTNVKVNGDDSFTIETSGKIWQYRYATVLGKKVAVDIYGGALAVSSTNISVNKVPVDKIRIAQYAVEPYKIVRVVFDLTDTAGEYSVTKSADGTSITVNFGKTASVTPQENNENPVIGEDGNTDLPEENTLNGITEIECESGNNNDTLTIYADEKPEYNVFTLSNPYRIIVDIDNSQKNVSELPDIDSSNYIKDIRFSQYTEDSTRLVIEVNDGAEFKSSEGSDYLKLTITKPAVSVSESIVNDGKTIRFTKTSGLDVNKITKTYDPYTGNTVINLGGNFSTVYGNKTLSYSIDSADASYIKTVKFGSSGGNTTITVTPSLIAEYNIYENGDYIYIDLVAPKSVYDTVVVIDAGHGGTKPGAVVNGVYEKNVTLDIARKVYNQLNGSGIKVYVTRFTDKDVDNYVRAYMANFGADMFISIHCNSISGNVDISGTETLYTPHSGEGDGKLTSYTLASTLQKYVSASAGTTNRGVKNRSDLIVLKRTTVPAALVETGFMTDSNDMALLTSESGRQKFADGICKAIRELASKY